MGLSKVILPLSKTKVSCPMDGQARGGIDGEWSVQVPLTEMPA
jgi:hypothetical protein